MEYEGDVYRPPSEARSLIIQVTIGCSHNKCTFCHMYADKQFRVRKREEIIADLEECRALYGPYVQRVFFADGDALVVKGELLLELLNYVKKNFPHGERCAAEVGGGAESAPCGRSRDDLPRRGVGGR